VNPDTTAEVFVTGTTATTVVEAVTTVLLLAPTESMDDAFLAEDICEARLLLALR